MSVVAVDSASAELSLDYRSIIVSCRHGLKIDW